MSDCLPYSQTNRFSKLFLDYIAEKPEISSFFNRFPYPQNFKSQIEEKQKNYQSSNRAVLVKRLESQYLGLNLSKLTQHHIELLQEETTFTVTTGHQLNLFTGPLYTFYKIISVIKSCRLLKEKYPENNFVPIFWLASEDHDFEEINHFYFSNQQIKWAKDAKGVVGEIETKHLEDSFEQFKKLLPDTKYAQKLVKLFKASYLDHAHLSDASLYLYNELFGEEGLVILEPNHPDLKSCFKKQIKQELISKTTFDKVSETSKKLGALGYHEQVTPREINFFYKSKNLRERLIYKDGNYFVNETEKRFSKDELLFEVDKHPENFSPNALLRPLYQEVLLPNLSYVGGAGELAYWFQLKSTFEHFDVTFPMLQMRNSVLLFSTKTQHKLKNLNLKVEDLFQSEIDLKNQHVKKISEIEIDFSPQKTHLSNQFKELYRLAAQTDKSFLNAVAAQEQKQHNGLDKLEKRLLKAQRRKLKDEIDRLITIQQKLFPNSSLQERVENFSDIYLRYGDDFLKVLFKTLNPFDYRFSLIELKSIPKSLNHNYTSEHI